MTVFVKQAEAEKACSTGFDANCPENVSRGILWPKRVSLINKCFVWKQNYTGCKLQQS